MSDNILHLVDDNKHHIFIDADAEGCVWLQQRGVLQTYQFPNGAQATAFRPCDDDRPAELAEVKADNERLKEALDYDIAEARKGDAWEIVEALAGWDPMSPEASPYAADNEEGKYWAGRICAICGGRPNNHTGDCLWLKAKTLVEKEADDDHTGN